MPRLLGRLPFLSRHDAADREPSGPAFVRAPIDPDASPVGPPVLLPATISHVVLLHSTEMTPVWLSSRPAPDREAAQVETPAKAPPPKAPRRTKAAAKPAEKPAAPKPAAPRKPRKPSSGRPTSR